MKVAIEMQVAVLLHVLVIVFKVYWEKMENLFFRGSGLVLCKGSPMGSVREACMFSISFATSPHSTPGFHNRTDVKRNIVRSHCILVYSNLKRSNPYFSTKFPLKSQFFAYIIPSINLS